MSSMRGGPPPRGWVRPGEVLLHIGLPKTGTTALQAALAEARPALRRHGVVYPGQEWSHWRPTAAILRMRRVGSPEGGLNRADSGEWEEFVREVEESPPQLRRVVSSELLCRADPDQIDRIVGSFGQVRVVVGLRRLDAQVVSAWQQRVKAGLDVGLDEWLHLVLEQDSMGERARSEDFAELRAAEVVERWAARVGPDAMTVVIVNAGGRAQLDVVESMLDLGPGVLQPSSDLMSSNRALSLEQVAVLLRYNSMIDRSTTTDGAYAEAMDRIVRSIRRSAVSSGSRIAAPNWVVPRLREIARATVDTIADSGVHVIGDLDDLMPAECGDAAASDAWSEPGLDRGATAGAEILAALFESGYIAGPHPHPLVKWIPPVMLPMVVRARDEVRARAHRWRFR